MLFNLWHQIQYNLYKKLYYGLDQIRHIPCVETPQVEHLHHLICGSQTSSGCCYPCIFSRTLKHHKTPHFSLLINSLVNLLFWDSRLSPGFLLGGFLSFFTSILASSVQMMVESMVVASICGCLNVKSGQQTT